MDWCNGVGGAPAARPRLGDRGAARPGRRRRPWTLAHVEAEPALASGGSTVATSVWHNVAMPCLDSDGGRQILHDPVGEAEADWKS